MELKPVITKNRAKHYVSEGDLVRFISDNSEMSWNKAGGFIQEVGLVSEHGPTLWDKYDVENFAAEYEKEAVEWMTKFFEAHPFINRVMFVFDD